MIVALDAQYDEAAKIGASAAVVFGHWQDSVLFAEYTAVCRQIEAYIPGQFYKRELPCLLAVLQQIKEPLDTIVIDGYVTLGDKPGLGIRLRDALSTKVPIVGVAKTSFRDAAAEQVLRGRSKTPLYITATGVKPTQAAANIRNMAGSFRIPTLLQLADRLARDELRRQLTAK
jgi:deoxyribonuclease V